MFVTIRFLAAVAAVTGLAPGAAQAHQTQQPLQQAQLAQAQQPQQPQPAKQAKLTPAERDARAREYFTDTVLKTQANRTVKFYSDTLKGKVVVLNFMYTHCGDACPLITAKLVQAKNDLGDASAKEVRFISISVDPERDTPEEMAKYARKFHPDHPDWIYLTGAKANVDFVLKKLGVYNEDFENHSTALIIGSPQQGRWKKVRPDEVIAEELRQLVAGEIEVRKTAVPVPAPGDARRP
jgi:cytochrome oxidase Cu insertion factor (SCO1/SenC/PrrC family)